MGQKLEGYVSQAEAARIRGVSPQAIADLIRRCRLNWTEFDVVLIRRPISMVKQAFSDFGLPRKLVLASHGVS